MYTDDIAPADCLCVKILHSPHANAMIEEIDVSGALKTPGVVCALTYQDAPQSRFTLAGQTYPEPSPYDRLILDSHLRAWATRWPSSRRRTRGAAEAAAQADPGEVRGAARGARRRASPGQPGTRAPEADWKALCDVGAD